MSWGRNTGGPGVLLLDPDVPRSRSGTGCTPGRGDEKGETTGVKTIVYVLKARGGTTVFGVARTSDRPDPSKYQGSDSGRATEDEFLLSLTGGGPEGKGGTLGGKFQEVHGQLLLMEWS